jgi:MFS family permease
MAIIPSVPDRDSRYAWYVAIILTLASTMSFIDRQILALMIGPIERDLHISDTMMGLLGGLAFMLFNTALVLPMAWLADRLSRRRIIAIGIAGWSLMTIVCGFANQFYQLFLARVGVGVGDAMASPASISMMSDYFSRHRLPLAIGTLLAAPFVGVGLANILGGRLVQYLETIPKIVLPLVGAVHSWQIAFILVGLPGVMLSLIFARTVSEPVRHGRADLSGADIPISAAIKFVISRMNFLIPQFAAYIALSIQGWALFYWVIELYIRQHGMARADIGAIYGVMALVLGISGSLLSGQVASHFQKIGVSDITMKLVLGASICLCPVAVAMPLVSSLPLALFLLALMTFFMAWPGGLGITALQMIVPNELRARIVGLYLVVVNFIAYSFGPLLGGFISDRLFAGPHALGNTLALMAAITYPLAALFTLLSLKPFRAAMLSAEVIAPAEATVAIILHA